MPDITLRILGDAKSAEEALTRTGKSAEEHLGKVDKASAGATSGMKGMVEGFAAVAVVAEVSKDYEDNQKALTTLTQAMRDAGEKDTPKFREELEKAGAAGRSLGFDTSQTSGAIAQLRLAGVDTSKAMEALPTIMDLARAKNITLSDATAAVVKGMQGQGKALKDLNIEMPPHIATSAQLDAANAKIAASTQQVEHDQELYTAAVKAHGPHSKQAEAAAYTLQTAQEKLSGEQQKAADIQKSLGDRTGNLGAVLDTLTGKVGGQAQAHTHDLGVQWDILKAQFNEVGGNVIQNVLMPALTAIMGGLGFVADHANTLVPILGGVAAGFVAWKVAMAAVAIGQFLSSGAGLAVFLVESATQAYISAGGFWAMAAGVLAATWPVVAIVAAIAAVIAVGVLLITHWDQVKATAQKVFPFILPFIWPIVAPIMAIVTAGKFLIDHWRDVLKAGQNMWPLIQVFIWPITFPIGLIVSAGKALISHWGEVWSTAQKVWGGISPFLFPITFPINLIITAGKFLISHWGEVWNTASSIFGKISGFVGGVANGIGSAFVAASNIVSGVFSGIAHIAKSVLNVPIGLINSVIGFIDDKIQIHIPAIGVGPVHTPAFDWNGLNIPKIPSLAGGSDFAYVGPAGVPARIFDNPAGERVQTAQQARDEAAANMRAGIAAAQRGPLNISVVAQTNADAVQISKEIAWQLRTAGAY